VGSRIAFGIVNLHRGVQKRPKPPRSGLASGT
jgi:hypothetical protein